MKKEGEKVPLEELLLFEVEGIHINHFHKVFHRFNTLQALTISAFAGFPSTKISIALCFPV